MTVTVICLGGKSTRRNYFCGKVHCSRHYFVNKNLLNEREVNKCGSQYLCDSRYSEKLWQNSIQSSKMSDKKVCFVVQIPTPKSEMLNSWFSNRLFSEKMVQIRLWWGIATPKRSPNAQRKWFHRPNTAARRFHWNTQRGQQIRLPWSRIFDWARFQIIQLDWKFRTPKQRRLGHSHQKDRRIGELVSFRRNKQKEVPGTHFVNHRAQRLWKDVDSKSHRKGVWVFDQRMGNAGGRGICATQRL